jgi:O-antigen/teichoic acid export membrane protein
MTANVITAAIPFFLLPFLTNHLTPYDYGIVAMFQALVQFITPLAGFNHTAAISRQYFEQEKINIRNYVGNSLYILLFTTIFILLILLAFRTPVAELTQMPANWLWVVVIYCFSQNLALTMLGLWRLEFKATKYGVFRISRTALEIGLSVLLILAFGMSWQGRIMGMVIAMLVFAFIALFFLYKNKWLDLKFNKVYIKDNLVYSTPLILHVLSSVIILFSDRLFITNMVGMAEQGLYSVGYTVGMIVYLIQNSFNQAWVPWFFGELKADKPKRKLQIVKFTYLYFIAMLMLVAFVTFFAPWFFETLLNKNYASAVQFVFWIALGFGFNGMYKMVVNYLLYTRHTMVVSLASLVTAALNIVLNYFFIKKFGTIGAAQASAISYFTQFVFIWYFAARKFKMPWLLKI